MNQSSNPENLLGITFFDQASQRKMRYIYPDASHWLAGWIVVLNPSGEWMTLRKATEADITSISGAVVQAHHATRDGVPVWDLEGTELGRKFKKHLERTKGDV